MKNRFEALTAEERGLLSIALIELRVRWGSRVMNNPEVHHENMDMLESLIDEVYPEIGVDEDILADDSLWDGLVEH